MNEALQSIARDPGDLACSEIDPGDLACSEISEAMETKAFKSQDCIPSEDLQEGGTAMYQWWQKIKKQLVGFVRSGL